MTDEERTEETEQETDPGYESDLIDDLIDALNAGVSGITFERDVLETNRPEDWGAVEMVGQDGGEWADGRMIDQTVTADIWICLSDRGSTVREEVQKVLRVFADEHPSSWRLVSRNYLYDLGKVMWRWTINIEEPLMVPEEGSAAEDPDSGLLDADAPNPDPSADDLDDLPFTDPEEDPDEYVDPEWPEIDE
jgi:hypothetical protein